MQPAAVGIIDFVGSFCIKAKELKNRKTKFSVRNMQFQFEANLRLL